MLTFSFYFLLFTFYSLYNIYSRDVFSIMWIATTHTWPFSKTILPDFKDIFSCFVYSFSKRSHSSSCLKRPSNSLHLDSTAAVAESVLVCLENYLVPFIRSTVLATIGRKLANIYKTGSISKSDPRRYALMSAGELAF